MDMEDMDMDKDIDISISLHNRMLAKAIVINNFSQTLAGVLNLAGLLLTKKPKYFQSNSGLHQNTKTTLKTYKHSKTSQ